jgi:hypothetical protein
MAAGAAFPGLFFCFAATVLLVIVSICRPLVLQNSSYITSGIYIITSMGENLIP